MTRIRQLAVLAAIPFALALAAAGCTSVPRSIQIASAGTSHTLCSSVFLAGRDADEVYAEEVRPAPGFWLIDWATRYRVDRERRTVTTTVAGGFTREAVYRDGLGCLAVLGDGPVPRPALDGLPPLTQLPPLQIGQDIAGPDLVVAANPRIRDAIARAFDEPPAPPWRRTKAVVVLHRGRIIGEQYAPGIGIDTPLNGHSMSKSMLHAMVGLLVRDGKLPAQGRAPVPEWERPGDPRRDITIDQLLRMSSGIPWDEYAGGFDPATRMWMAERDKHAFAAQAVLEAAPGTRWNYSDRGYTVLSRLVRDAAGGDEAGVLRFARRELFAPLGMRHVTLEFDATGTPMGSNSFHAPARDWARLGRLYLDDGVIGGRRVLPADWVRDATRPTLDAGYGSSFWLNIKQTPHPLPGHWGMPGAPAEAYFARGVLGQFIVVVPSRQLVVVRMGASAAHGDIASTGRLVGDIVEALAPSNTSPP